MYLAIVACFKIWFSLAVGVDGQIWVCIDIMGWVELGRRNQGNDTCRILADA